MGVYMVEQPLLMERKMQEATKEAEKTLQRLKDQVQKVGVVGVGAAQSRVFLPTLLLNMLFFGNLR